MEKKLQVVMLPIKGHGYKVGDVIKNVNLQPDHLTISVKVGNDNWNWQPQHIYLTSQDKVKEGDWVIRSYYPPTNGLIDSVCNYSSSIMDHHSIKITKIIAATDPQCNLPGISPEDLQWLVDNNMPKEISVEWNDYIATDQFSGKSIHFAEPYLRFGSIVLIKPQEDINDAAMRVYLKSNRTGTISKEAIIASGELRDDPIEEAAKEYAKKNYDYNVEDSRDGDPQAMRESITHHIAVGNFKAGAKWVQEQAIPSCKTFADTHFEIANLCSKCKADKTGRCRVITQVESSMKEQSANKAIEMLDWMIDSNIKLYYNPTVRWRAGASLYTSKDLYELWLKNR